jgi:uncharacterized protein involved in type VI secretion and phage assembly
MLSFEGKPDFLKEYTVSGFEVRQALGCIGTLTISLNPVASSREPPFADHAALQECLGTEFTCVVDEDWKFSGVAEAVQYNAMTQGFELIIADLLSGLEKTFASRVYAEQKLSAIVKDKVSDCQFLGDDRDVWLAIQYQESDLAFLKRVLGNHGSQIWCEGGKIYAGTKASSDDHELKLGRDVADFTVTTCLGPESVDVKPYQYAKFDSAEKSKKRTALKGEGSDKLQSSSAGVREKYAAKSVLHVIGDELDEAAEGYGVQFLRSRASGRLRVRGMLAKPIPLGGLVSVQSSEWGGAGKKVVEPCLVRELTGASDSSGASWWRFEAVNREALLCEGDAPPAQTFATPAIVQEADETLNVVKVYFPWDPELTETPPLRLLVPSWGDGHMNYVRPLAGDTVLVSWGQRDMDPIVLGSIAVGNKVGRDDLMVLRILSEDQKKGHTIAVDKKTIRFHNEADKGDSYIEIRPDAIEIKTKNGQQLLIGARGIELDAGGGMSIKMESGKVTVSATEIHLASKGLGEVEVGPKSVSVNKGALEVT